VVGEKLYDIFWDIIGEVGSLRHKMVQGASGSFALKVGKAGFGLLTSILLARILGADGYGLYAYALSWVKLLVIPGVMGLRGLLTREVASYKVKRDWCKLHSILHWSDRMALAVSVGVAVLGAGGIWLFRGQLAQGKWSLLIMAMLLVPLLAFVDLRQGGVRGLGHVLKAQVPKKLVLPVAFLGMFGILYISKDLNAFDAIGARVGSSVIAVMVGTFFLRQGTSGRKLGSWREEYPTKKWLKSSLPFLVARSGNTASQQVPVFITGILAGPEAAGIYDVVRRGTNLVKFVLDAINMPLAPMVSSLYSEKKMAQFQDLVIKGARLSLVGSLPIGLMFVFYGDWYLDIYGESFMAGYSSLVVLSIGRVIEAGMGSVGYILNMTGYERVTAIGSFFTLLLIVLSCIIVVPEYGVFGAAVCTTTGIVTLNLGLHFYISHELGINSSAIRWKKK
jgi:O-antigen/teichoic acid export membrane protein